MREPERARTRSQLRAENGHLFSLFLVAYFGFGARQDVGFSQKPLVVAYTAPAARALSFFDCYKVTRDLFKNDIFPVEWF